MKTKTIVLISIAIAFVGSIIISSQIMEIKRIERDAEESKVRAIQDAERAHKARMGAWKPLEDMYKKYRTIGDRAMQFEDEDPFQNNGER